MFWHLRKHYVQNVHFLLHVPGAKVAPSVWFGRLRQPQLFPTSDGVEMACHFNLVLVWGCEAPMANATVTFANSSPISPGPAFFLLWLLNSGLVHTQVSLARR